MGGLSVIGKAIIAVLLVIVILPLIIVISALVEPLWYAIFNATLSTLGSSNPLTIIVYYIYLYTKWCVLVLQQAGIRIPMVVK